MDINEMRAMHASVCVCVCARVCVCVRVHACVCVTTVVDSITKLWTIILYYVTIYSASVLRAHAAFHTDNVLSVVL